MKSKLFAVLVCLGLLFAAPVAGEEPADSPGEAPPQSETIAPEQTAPTYDRLGVEQPTGLARASLVSSQTLHGAILGFQACFAIGNCDSPRIAVGLPTLGASLGLGASLYLTHDRGVIPGEAAALSAGPLFGAWTGFWSVAIADEVGMDNPSFSRTMMPLQIGGLAGAFALSRLLRPTAGDVSLVRHSALWAAIFYASVTEGIIELDQSLLTLAVGMITAPTLAAVGAGVLAGYHPVPRSRVLVSSAGGLVGGLLGALTTVLIFGENIPNRQALWTPATVGAAGGLAAGIYFTRDWEHDEPSAVSTFPTLAPSFDGEGFVGGISGQF